MKRDRRRKGREEGESSVEMKVTYNETHKVGRLTIWRDLMSCFWLVLAEKNSSTAYNMIKMAWRGFACVDTCTVCVLQGL